jgi:hypothetical protein
LQDLQPKTVVRITSPAGITEIWRLDKKIEFFASHFHKILYGIRQRLAQAIRNGRHEECISSPSNLDLKSFKLVESHPRLVQVTGKYPAGPTGDGLPPAYNTPHNLMPTQAGNHPHGSRPLAF